MAILNPVPSVRQLVRLGVFSCHLVEEDDGLALFDTNLPGSAPGIAAEIARLGKPLRQIFLTHAHSDHVGSLDALAERFPQAEIITTARTARLLSGDRSLDPDEVGMALKGGYRTTRTTPTRLVEDGEEYAGFRAVATPGHAVGHVSWQQVSTGFVFCGDALVSAGGGLHVSGVFRLGFPFPYFATASCPKALESARKLAALAPTALLPVHGPAIRDPAAALARAIDEAARAFG